MISRKLKWLVSGLLMLIISLPLFSQKATGGITMEKMHVTESGSDHAKVILFLHGSGAESGMWKDHIAQLSSTFHCIAPDLPGHGKSNHLGWTTLDEVAESLAGMIKEKGKGPVHVVGLSLGGSLIYRLLELHPELIDRALIDGASAVPIKGSFGVIMGVTMVSPLLHWDPVIKVMAKSLDVKDDGFEDFRNNMKTVSRRSFRKAMNQANRARLDLENCQIKSPVFFVSGSKESPTMHHSHKVLAAKVSGSGFAWYPGKGHAWMVSDSDTHIQLVRYWLLNSTFPQLLVKNPLE
jgi:pimeloyl-ACP methyl ester carboxylesterase